MATWSDLQSLCGVILDDSGHQIHSSTFLQTYLEYGELLFTLTKGWYEVTGDLSLTSSTPLYTIHSTFSDFILPLRITINNTALRNGSFQSVASIDKNWFTSSGTPDMFFMLGTTLLGFYQTPSSSLTAKVTYLAVPPKDITDTTLSPKIQANYHRILPHFVSSIAFAREGQVDRAIDQLKLFVEAIGRPLDKRLSDQLKQSRKQVQANEKSIRNTGD